MLGSPNITVRTLAALLQEPIGVTNALAILLLLTPMLASRRTMTISEVVAALHHWAYPGAKNATMLADTLRKIAHDDACFAFDDEADTVAIFSTSHLINYAIAAHSSAAEQPWVTSSMLATEMSIRLDFTLRGVALNSREARLLVQNAAFDIEPASSSAPDVVPFDVSADELMRVDPLMLTRKVNRQEYTTSVDLRQIDTLLSLPKSKVVLSMLDRMIVAFMMATRRMPLTGSSLSDRVVELHVDNVIRALIRPGFWANMPRDEIEREIMATAHAESAFAVVGRRIRILDTNNLLRLMGDIVIRPSIQEFMLVPIDKRNTWKSQQLMTSAISGYPAAEMVRKVAVYIQTALSAPHAETRLGDHDLLSLGTLLLNLAASAAGHRPTSFYFAAAADELQGSGFAPESSISDLTGRLLRAARLYPRFCLSDDGAWFGLRQEGKTMATLQRVLHSAVVEELYVEALDRRRGSIAPRKVRSRSIPGARVWDARELHSAVQIAHVPGAGISLGDLLAVALFLKTSAGASMAQAVGDGACADPASITLQELRYWLVVRCRMARVVNPYDVLASAGTDPRFSLAPDGLTARILERDAIRANVEAMMGKPSVNEILESMESHWHSAEVRRYWGSPARFCVPEGELLVTIPLETWTILLAAADVRTLVSDVEICILVAVLTMRGFLAATTPLKIDEFISTCFEHNFGRDMPYSRFVDWVRDVIRGTPLFALTDDGETIFIRRIIEVHDMLKQVANRLQLDLKVLNVAQSDAVKPGVDELDGEHSATPAHSSAEPSKKPDGPFQTKPSRPAPKAKAARVAPVKLPELPAPPPFPPNTVDFPQTVEEELLKSHERTVIPRMRITSIPLRPAHARTCAEKFALRNGIIELGQVSMTAAEYLVIQTLFSVKADAVHEGESFFIVGNDGGAPDESLAAAYVSEGIPHGEPRLGLPADMARWIAARLRPVLERASNAHVRNGFARYAAEQNKLILHFAALAAALAPSAADVDPSEIQRLTTTRNDAISELAQRFRVGVSCTRMVFSWVEVPVALVLATLRRRKASRTILLRVPAGANAVDFIRCEICNDTAKAPAACDGTLHLLCEKCAPNAFGRIACTLCD